ncbi:MAG: SIMPL domain-containing protein [Patescibacteria group bacterium]
MSDPLNINPPMRIQKAIIAVLSVLFVFLVFKSITEFKMWSTIGSSDQNVITVSGTGETFAVPDIATFTFSVVENGKTVAEAQDKATTKNNAAIKYLKDAGIADKDIKTESYNANPQYAYNQIMCIKYPCPPSQTLTGYEVSQTISVKVRDTSKAGNILSGVGALGVSNISGLTFTIDNEDALKAEARSKAIADARSKAEALAKDLGVGLGKVASFSENTGAYPVYAMKSEAMAVGGGARDVAAPSVPTGENKVTIDVTVTYKIR